MEKKLKLVKIVNRKCIESPHIWFLFKFVFLLFFITLKFIIHFSYFKGKFY